MSKFEETFEQLRMEQEDLDERMDKIRKEAVAHIQAIVDQFGLKSSDIRFYDSTESAVAKKPRKSSAPKYRLPTGERQKFCVHGIIGARQTGASNEHEHQTQFS